MKDLGVVVIGLAVVEIAWAILGGSPVDQSLHSLDQTTNDLTTTLGTETAAMNQRFADTSKAIADQLGATSKAITDQFAATSTQFNSDVRHISKLVAGGTRTGLVDVGESQNFLG